MKNEEKLKELKKRLSEENLPELFLNNRDLDGKSVEKIVEEIEAEYKGAKDSANQENFKTHKSGLEDWAKNKED